MDVFSYAHRILNKLSSFHALNGNDLLPAKMPQLPALTTGETGIGVYVNNQIDFTDLVLVTSKGVHVFKNNYWEGVQYSEIEKAETPDNKEKVYGINLRLRSGEGFWLPITGNKAGRFFDAFDVLRFFDRILTQTTPDAADR